MVSLEDFLASCPNPEVQANKDVYAEKMRASGFGNLPSLLAQDDEEMEEMHKELKTLIPPGHSMQIRKLLKSERDAAHDAGARRDGGASATCGSAGASRGTGASAALTTGSSGGGGSSIAASAGTALQPHSSSAQASAPAAAADRVSLDHGPYVRHALERLSALADLVSKDPKVKVTIASDSGKDEPRLGKGFAIDQWRVSQGRRRLSSLVGCLPPSLSLPPSLAPCPDDAYAHA